MHDVQNRKCWCEDLLDAGKNKLLLKGNESDSSEKNLIKTDDTVQ